MDVCLPPALGGVLVRAAFVAAQALLPRPSWDRSQAGGSDMAEPGPAHVPPSDVKLVSRVVMPVVTSPALVVPVALSPSAPLPVACAVPQLCAALAAFLWSSLAP